MFLLGTKKSISIFWISFGKLTLHFFQLYPALCGRIQRLLFFCQLVQHRLGFGERAVKKIRVCCLFLQKRNVLLQLVDQAREAVQLPLELVAQFDGGFFRRSG